MGNVSKKSKKVIPNKCSKVVCYTRVSTKKQGLTTLGLTAQKNIINNAIKEYKWEPIGTFYEEICSGGKEIYLRKSLIQALQDCQNYNCILVISSVDRLSRSYDNLKNILSLNYLNIYFCDIKKFSKSNINEILELGKSAENEKKLIGKRTKQSLDARIVTLESITDSPEEKYKKMMMPILKDMDGSPAEKARKLRILGYKGIKGGELKPNTIKKLQERWGIIELAQQ